MKIQRVRHAVILTTLLILASPFTMGKTSSDHSTKPIDPQNIKKANVWLATRANDLMKKTGLPGMAIAVVHDGRVIYRKGFGVRNVDTKLKVKPETVFQLASVSKSLASTVVAGAVGRGLVKWDDRVQQFYPDFTLKNPEVASQVTIADMFSHRSGLPGEAGDDLEVFGCNRLKIIHQLRLFPLQPFRTTYNYSNFGLTVGAMAAANAAHKSWEDLSDKVLYKPLAMHKTSSRWSDYDKTSNKADLHVESTPGHWVVSHRQPDAQSPAGGVSSNVNDMAKWMILQINDGRDAHQHKIIDKAALLRTREKWMQMPANPILKATTYYGLGIVWTYDETGRLRLMHSGAFSAGAATSFDMLPSEKLGIIILTNGSPKGIPEAIALEYFDIVEYGHVKSDRFSKLSEIFNMRGGHSELDGNPPSNPAAAPQPNTFIGAYTNEYFGRVTIEAKGNGFQLVISPCGKDYPVALTHWDGNTFSFQTDIYAPLSALQFMPSKDNNPAKIYIKSLDGNGFGTFTRSP